MKSSGLKCIFNSLSYVSAEVPPTISELPTQQRSAVARSSDALMWLETDLLHHQATVCSCWPLGLQTTSTGCPSVSYPFGKAAPTLTRILFPFTVPEMSWSLRDLVKNVPRCRQMSQRFCATSLFFANCPQTRPRFIERLCGLQQQQKV